MYRRETRSRPHARSFATTCRGYCRTFGLSNCLLSNSRKSACTSAEEVCQCCVTESHHSFVSLFAELLEALQARATRNIIISKARISSPRKKRMVFRAPSTSRARIAKLLLAEACKPADEMCPRRRAPDEISSRKLSVIWGELNLLFSAQSRALLRSVRRGAL